VLAREQLIGPRALVVGQRSARLAKRLGKHGAPTGKVVERDGTACCTNPDTLAAVPASTSVLIRST